MMKNGFHVPARRDMPIKNKLIWISLMTTGAALLLIGVALILSEILTFRSEIIDDVTAKAEVIGENSRAAITFNDNDAARDTLRALATSPNIVHAVIYTRDFDVLAGYSRNGEGQVPSQMKSEGYLFGVNSLDMLRKIVLDNQIIGYVYIQSDLRDLYFQLAWHGVTILLAIGLSIFIAYIIISRMQQSITTPIHDMAGLMQMISHAQDYSVRTAVDSNDELGTLAKGFNDMLEQIQKRDAELEQHRKSLEDTIKKRTYQLSSANEQLQQELVERKRTEEELKRRDVILDALSCMAERFMSASDLMQSIYENLKLLGKATEVSRIYIYENRKGPADELMAYRRYEWFDRSISPHMINPEGDEISYDATGFYTEAFALKQVIHGHVKDFPDLQRPIFEKADAKSVIIVPIFVNNNWWGFIWLTQCNNERIWSAAEIDVLRTAADILGAAIHRKQTEQELLTARDAAMDASRAKSSFLAVMSHEIRTPMNAIIGFTEVLKETSMDKAQSEYLAIVKNSAHGLLDIINGILDFSRIESGKLEIARTEFGIAQEIENMIEALFIKATKKNCELTIFIDPVIPGRLIGDPVRIKQVMTNLIGNAIKFSRDGGYIHVDIIRESADEDRGIVNVHFSVQDNGIGIPEDKQSLIFEPFTQADYSLTRRYGGTGLGLSIANDLVKFMGGKLSLESASGKGSRFFFTVGLECLDPSHMQIPALESDLSIALCNFYGDYSLNEKTVERYLKAMGCKTYSVNEMSELAGIGNVDAVFVSVPPSDADVAGRIREIRNTRVIAITNSAGRGTADLHSFEDVICKPVYLSKLIMSIDEIKLGRAPAARGLDAGNRSEKRQFHSTVLIAEDVPDNQRLVEIMLNASAIEVEIANNGHEAFEKYRTGNYDIIFMDIHMPVCNGRDATKMIRQYEQKTMRPHTPIIALTADAMKGSKEQFLADGMDEYISKPIDRNVLNAMLEKYLTSKAYVKVPERAPDPCDDAVDIARLAHNFGIPQTMVIPIVQKIVSSMERDLHAMLECRKSGNYSLMREIAHKIKGSSANLYSDKINALSIEIHKIAKGELNHDLVPVLERLEFQIDHLKKSLG